MRLQQSGFAGALLPHGPSTHTDKHVYVYICTYICIYTFGELIHTYKYEENLNIVKYEERKEEL